MLRMHAKGGTGLPCTSSTGSETPPAQYPLFLNVFSPEQQQWQEKQQSCFTNDAAHDAMHCWDAWERMACIASDDENYDEDAEEYVRIYHAPMLHDARIGRSDDEGFVPTMPPPTHSIGNAGATVLARQVRHTPSPLHEDEQVPRQRETFPKDDELRQGSDCCSSLPSSSEEEDDEEKDQLFVPTSRVHRCRKSASGLRKKMVATKKSPDRKARHMANKKREQAHQSTSSCYEARKRFPPHIKQCLDDALLHRTLFPEEWMCARNRKLSKFMPKVLELSSKTGLSAQQIRNYMHNNARKGQRLAKMHSDKNPVP